MLDIRFIYGKQIIKVIAVSFMTGTQETKNERDVVTCVITPYVVKVEYLRAIFDLDADKLNPMT